MLSVEDGGSRFFRNVGKFLPHYMASGGKASDLYSGVPISDLGRDIEYFEEGFSWFPSVLSEEFRGNILK
jgi:hypothetical protein